MDIHHIWLLFRHVRGWFETGQKGIITGRDEREGSPLQLLRSHIGNTSSTTTKGILTTFKVGLLCSGYHLVQRFFVVRSGLYDGR